MGPIWTMNVVKSIPAALPIRMFGGSPMRVAVPPMLQASISAMRNGSGFSRSCSVTKRVTGTTSTTIVTLSRKAELSAVTTQRTRRIRTGRPRPSRTAWTASHWKSPVSRRMLAMTIIPTSRKMTFQSMARNASAWVRTRRRIIATPPSMAETVRWTRSVTMRM